jgi:hypothetical protein
MNLHNPPPVESPRWRRWFLAAAATLEAAWMVLLAILAIVR